jgi:hypothetical protein
MPAVSPRFVGGMRYEATGGVRSGRWRLSWPFAILEVQTDNVLVAPRGVFKRFLASVEMPRSSITKVEVGFGVSKTGIRFRLPGPDDGTVFWAFAETRAAAVEALRRSGFPID